MVVGENCIILNIATKMGSLWFFFFFSNAMWADFLFFQMLCFCFFLFVLPLHLLEFGGTKHDLHILK